MKVSIITVSCNNEDNLENTIKSVCNQDYPDIEYLFIDLESSVDTLALLEKYKGKIARVPSMPDQGMYDTLNKGIDLAKGELIGILKPGSFYSNLHVITDVVKAIQAKEANACYGDLVYLNRGTLNKIGRYRKSCSYDSGRFRWDCIPEFSAFFIKKNCYSQFGKFNLNLASAIEYELLLRLIYCHQIKVTYLPKSVIKIKVIKKKDVNFTRLLLENREREKAWRINGLKPSQLNFKLNFLKRLSSTHKCESFI